MWWMGWSDGQRRLLGLVLVSASVDSGDDLMHAETGSHLLKHAQKVPRGVCVGFVIYRILARVLLPSPPVIDVAAGRFDLWGAYLEQRVDGESFHEVVQRWRAGAIPLTWEVCPKLAVGVLSDGWSILHVVAFGGS
jgi:hypothetical protein